MNLESLMVKDCFTILLLERPSAKGIESAADLVNVLVTFNSL